MENLPALLRNMPYPGRGILLGRDTSGLYAVAAYFIMGRSENSRNRIFVPTEDGIRTEAKDPARMTDPSLIIYHPVRQAGRTLIVANGNHADTLQSGILSGGSCFSVLSGRTFEPDAPHYTPRISGLLFSDGSFTLSILKAAESGPDCCQRFFYTYDHPPAGEGRFLCTYQGDGLTPLRPFQGEPVRVELKAPDAVSLAAELWEALNAENKVALFVRYVDLQNGTSQDSIRNRA